MLVGPNSKARSPNSGAKRCLDLSVGELAQGDGFGVHGVNRISVTTPGDSLRVAGG